jgi:hypothetical protein
MMKPQDTSASPEESTRVPARKAYQKPQLQVYGDLTEITQSVMGSMMNDGSGHPNMHFTS